MQYFGDTSAEYILGSSTSDVLYGGGGGDIISGAGDDDLIVGGVGEVDELYGGDGDDVLASTPEMLSFDSWSDLVTDQDIGYDEIDGGSGDDLIFASSRAFGGDGNDTILLIRSYYSFSGLVEAGAGDDTIVFGPVGHSGTINAESGSDTLVFFGAGTGSLGFGAYSDDGTDRAIIAGAFNGDVYVDGLGPGDVIEFSNVPGINSIADLQGRFSQAGWYYDIRLDIDTRIRFGLPDAWPPIFKFNETNLNGLLNTIVTRTQELRVPVPILGTELTDNLLGSDDGEEIRGLGGNDTVQANGGNDTVYGGAGNDNLYGGDGDDSLSGEDGTDIIDGGIGNDYLYGGDGRNRLKGGLGDDRIEGGDGYD